LVNTDWILGRISTSRKYDGIFIIRINHPYRDKIRTDDPTILATSILGRCRDAIDPTRITVYLWKATGSSPNFHYIIIDCHYRYFDTK
jgi:hypothetical protein